MSGPNCCDDSHGDFVASPASIRPHHVVLRIDLAMPNKADSKPGVDRLGSFVNALTIPVLWLTITDAVYNICVYGYNVSNVNLLVVAGAGAIIAWMISKCCRKLMAPSQMELSDEDFDKDQRYLQRALSASLTGVVLIVLEPILESYIVNDEFGFRYEELLLASSGLNILIEEARLSRQYQTMRLRRNEAERESDRLIEQIERFRSGVVKTFNRKFPRSLSRNP